MTIASNFYQSSPKKLLQVDAEFLAQCFPPGVVFLEGIEGAVGGTCVKRENNLFFHAKNNGKIGGVDYKTI